MQTLAASVLAGLTALAPGGPIPTGVAQGPAAAVEDLRLERFYGQDLPWTKCRRYFECATLKVPLDYADPAGPALGVKVLRLRASDPDMRIGSLVVNPGGPGGSGVEYAQAAEGGWIVGRAVRRVYDVVGFDPRGVGMSVAVDCLSDAQLDRFLNADPDPDTEAEVARAVKQAKMFADGCAARSPDLVGRIGTPAVARDLDILRSALGEEQLDYLGASYGTYLGAIYADLFPHRVGRFVLDGAVDPRLTSARLSRDQAIGFDKALNLYARWCVQYPDCPFTGEPRAGVRAIADLLDDIEEDPMPASPGRPLTGAQAKTAVLGAMYGGRRGWAGLNHPLRKAFRGNGRQLQKQADWYTDRSPGGRYRSNGNEALYAVNCIDRPDRWSPRQTAAQARRWTARAPVFGRLLAWGNLPCTYWHAPAVDTPRRITAESSAPIVVIGTEHDPATPYKWAVGLAGQLRNGVLVSFMGGETHTAYHLGFRLGSRCINQAVDRYLVEGKVPKDGLQCRFRPGVRFIEH
jgi:pimeloyl-ACP methyl ester carboxylesterase